MKKAHTKTSKKIKHGRSLFFVDFFFLTGGELCFTPHHFIWKETVSNDDNVEKKHMEKNKN